MSTPIEWNRKISVSVGAIVFLVVAIFTGTTVYTNITTLENRMDKRYNRLQDELTSIKRMVDEQHRQIIRLEKATGI